MTLIHTASPPRPTGMDDGQALQRRLLHDMERQWLSTWAQADQQHDRSKPDAPSAAAGAAQASVQTQGPLAPMTQDPPDATGDVQCLAACQAGMPVQPSAPRSVADAPAEGGTAQAFAWQPRPVSETQAGAGATAGSPMLDGPQRSQDLESGSQAAPSVATALQASLAAGPASPGGVSGLAFQAMPEGESTAESTAESRAESQGTPQAQALPPTVPRAAPAYEGQQPVASATLGKSLALPQGLAAPVAMRPTGGDEASAEASAPAAPPAKPGTAGSDELTKDRQRLTLRELDTSSVHAILRDAQLDAQASGLAARSLHHALMEAGYARVRVVVNGQTARTDSVSGAPADRDDAQGAPQATSTTSRRTSTPPSQENTDGYQP